MYFEIENDVIEQLLLPKKEEVINKLIHFITNEAEKLVEENVELKVINFIHDLPFTFDYYILPDNSIIDYKYHTAFSKSIDYRGNTDSKIMDSIISNYLSEHEEIEPDSDTVFEWVSDWESENKEVEYNFFSDCWIEAKKRTRSEMRALLYEHECWSNSFELDDKVFINQEKHFEYLTNKGISIKQYQ